jgi:hypothetical protein
VPEETVEVDVIGAWAAGEQAARACLLALRGRKAASSLMSVPLALLLLLAAPDGGLSSRFDGGAASSRQATTEARQPSANPGNPALAAAAPPSIVTEPPVRAPLAVRSVVGTRDFLDVQSGASTTGGRAQMLATPREPSTQTAIREPGPGEWPDGGLDEGRLSGGRADGGEPFASLPRRAPSATNADAGDRLETLVDQSREQTEALQALATQQAAAEQARAAEQQARAQRVLGLEDARGSIATTVQSLQTGNWDVDTLATTGAALRRSADAAAAAGAGNEAARTAEAANLLDAAQAALTQRNAQQAQWYLAQASQLLGEAQSTRER